MIQRRLLELEYGVGDFLAVFLSPSLIPNESDRLAMTSFISLSARLPAVEIQADGNHQPFLAVELPQVSSASSITTFSSLPLSLASFIIW